MCTFTWIAWHACVYVRSTHMCRHIQSEKTEIRKIIRRRRESELWTEELFSAKPHGGRTTRAKIFHQIFSLSGNCAPISDLKKNNYWIFIGFCGLCDWWNHCSKLKVRNCYGDLSHIFWIYFFPPPSLFKNRFYSHKICHVDLTFNKEYLCVKCVGTIVSNRVGAIFFRWKYQTDHQRFSWESEKKNWKIVTNSSGDSRDSHSGPKFHCPFDFFFPLL